MEENKNKRISFLVDDDPDVESGMDTGDRRSRIEKIKKPSIFILMGLAFLGYLYLIFSPSKKDVEQQQKGLNDTVPQAKDAGMQADKQKAYEQALLEQKEKEKREGLMALSDYWNGEDKSDTTASQGEVIENEGQRVDKSGNAALNSYRNVQNELGSFYKQDNGEADALRREVAALRQELEEKNTPEPYNVNNQLALMEKSYEMASKFLPSNAQQSAGPQNDSTTKKEQKPPVIPMYAAKNSVVSVLRRQPTSDGELESWNENRNMRFFSAGSQEKTVVLANSIKACIHETQTVTADNGVRIRLLEDTKIQGMTVPKGNLLTAIAKFQANRLQLIVTSVEYKGNILPVEITAYDIDGQPGLYVPISAERGAITEIVANMGTSAGTSVSLSSTPGQQVASDLSRSAVQGISGYFAKKVRQPKVTLKAGHKLLLLSKK